MPHANPEDRRAYYRAYKLRQKSQRNAAPPLHSRDKRRANQWAAGHSDFAVCLACGLSITKKPISCTEPRHHASYHSRRERNNAYRREQRAAARAAGTVYRKGYGNLERKAQYNRDRHIALRDRLFAILGGPACIRCGFSDKRALHFDHINGGGAQHRRSLRSGTAYYKMLATLSNEQLRATFQVLCANCNCIKRVEQGEWGRSNA